MGAHLGQAVGDEQHRAVALLPPLHHGEDARGQVRRQGGGDLVEHEQFGIERQCPGEVEHAQERQRQVSHLLVEIEPVEVHRGQLGPHRTDVGAGQPEVLGDGEVGCEGRVLEDGRQPGRLGIARPAQLGRPAVDGDGAGVGVQDAGEDLDHRRLAGTVGAEQGVRLARAAR